jgi:hypothetical protein
MYEFCAGCGRIGDADRAAAGHEHVDPSAYAYQLDRHRDRVADAADDLAAVLSPDLSPDVDDRVAHAHADTNTHTDTDTDTDTRRPANDLHLDRRAGDPRLGEPRPGVRGAAVRQLR